MDISKVNLKPKTLEEALETIGQLAEVIVGQQEEISRLKEQLNTNSKNSSQPPSKDYKSKKQTKVKSGRTQGAQPGHKAYQRAVVPLEEVSKVIVCALPSHCSCGEVLKVETKVERHQVYEVPKPEYEVIEYQIQKGRCQSCRRRYQGALPEGVSRKGFGVRAQAMVSLLSSKYRLSKRLVHDWFADVYQMPVSLGSVSNIEHTVSQSLQITHAAIKVQVQASPVIHLDETGHKERHQNGWAWIMSTQEATYLQLARSKGRKIAKALIGNFQGHVYVTDRYPVYHYLPASNHQLCWAHLKRDFQRISERKGEAGKIGRKLLKAYGKLFEYWKTQYHPNLAIFKKQRKRLRVLKARLLRSLRDGTHCSHQVTARTCSKIWESRDSLWRFFEQPHVPPTNNHAERQLRPLVISKKLTFGTQSERGSRFIERIFSVVATCKQQGNDVLDCLTQAVYQWNLSLQKPLLLSGP